MKNSKLIAIITLFMIIIQVISPLTYAIENEETMDNSTVQNVETQDVKARTISTTDNEEIEFKNDNLKNYFLENYDTDNDKKITTADLEQISELILPYVEGLEGEYISIEFVENCTSLTRLIIWGDNYTDFNVLQSLPALKELSLSCYNISSTDYSSIIQLQNLEKLSLSSIYLEQFKISDLPRNVKSLRLNCFNADDISDIKEFTELENLEIESMNNENVINGIENINLLTKLTNLSFMYSNLKDISFLKNNTTLKYLNLQGNMIEDITVLKDNAKIEKLDVSNNKIKDISVIETMTGLKSLKIENNRIEDLSILENSTLLNETYYAYQDIYMNNINVLEGEKIEVDTPKIIRDCFDANNQFYIQNAEVTSTSDDDTTYATLNEDGSKVIIDATNLSIGERQENMCINGNGNLAYTEIYLTYRVVKSADSTTEVEFTSEDLKQYLLQNYDVDGDKKITSYDMVQITELTIPYMENVELIDLQGLEYCTSLENLEVVPLATNFNAITNLPNLTKLRVASQIENDADYQAITKISNLKSIELNMIENSKIFELPSQIEELAIYNSDITDIQNISKFTNLTSLTIISGSYNEIQGLNVIRELTNLKSLEINSKHIKDLSFLENNNTIESLTLRFNCIEDVTPITTMTNLKNLDITYNNIRNITVLENMSNIFEYSNNFQQNVRLDNIIVNRGEKLEIDLPDTIKACFDSNSKFYINNAKVEYVENDYYNKNISLNEDKTKIIIDATNDTIGTKTSEIYIYGDGRLSGTSLQVEYRVIEKADNTKRIEFENKELEEYLLKNYDEDKDGKITEYDMVQIENLEISLISIENTKGLEYATNLKTLSINVRYQNYNENIDYDFSHLSKLSNLKDLKISGDAYRFNILKDLENIEMLTISLDHEEKKATEQLEQIRLLTNLKSLKIYSGQIKNLDLIRTLTNLEEFEINPNYIENLDAIGDFVNLKNLNLTLYQYSNETIQIEYTFLKKLVNLESLYLQDASTENIDANNLSNMKKLKSLTVCTNELLNVDKLSGLTELQTLNLNGCKIKSVEFVKSLTKLENIIMKSNFITDITPLEEIDAWYMDFSNNPIQQIDEQCVKLIEAKKSNRLILTDYELMENLHFENEEFKKQLINSSYDFNKDGEISKYELSQISYLYANTLIENAQYMTGLDYLNISYITLTKTEQEKLIEQINLLNDNVNININSITIDLGIIEPEQTEVEINETAPIFVEMQRVGSKIYKEGLTIEEQYDYEDVAEIKDGKIYFNKDIVGNVGYQIKVSNSEGFTSLIYRWKNIIKGDTTKEIEIEDSILKRSNSKRL